MEERHIRETAEALAFIIGDRRDDPLKCARCGSVDLTRDMETDRLYCACGCVTTGEVAHRFREDAARERIRRGVGGPFVDAFEERNSRGT